MCVGLSPLARGTQVINNNFSHWRRFIPARAGNTMPLSVRLIIFSVYPRSRGEHVLSVSPVFPAGGLSPLARGTRHQLRIREEIGRFIPARAGNTTLPERVKRSRPVYPRSRGEHSSCRDEKKTHNGLSPLARGTPSNAAPKKSRSRFIPARAGNTIWLNGKICTPSGLSPLARGTL